MVAPVYVLYRNEGGDFAQAVALKTEEGNHIMSSGDTDRSTVTERICTEPTAEDEQWFPEIAGAGDPMAVLRGLLLG